MPEDRKDGQSNEQPGEGNREADRQYRESTKRFIDKGGVEPAAKDARRAVEDAEQRQGLDEAERIGKSHIAEEDPQVKRR